MIRNMTFCHLFATNEAKILSLDSRDFRFRSLLKWKQGVSLRRRDIYPSCSSPRELGLFHRCLPVLQLVLLTAELLTLASTTVTWLLLFRCCPLNYFRFSCVSPSLWSVLQLSVPTRNGQPGTSRQTNRTLSHAAFSPRQHYRTRGKTPRQQTKPLICFVSWTRRGAIFPSEPGPSPGSSVSILPWKLIINQWEINLELKPGEV